MTRGALGFALALAIAACSGPSSEPAPVEAGPVPPPALVALYPGCSWGEVRVADVSVWSFTCENGDRLVPDPSLPGFVRERVSPEGLQRTPMIRIFEKPADAPIDAVLPALRAASPGGEACVLQPIEATAEWFQLMPAGMARVAYDGFIRGESDGPSMPCGPLGPSEGRIKAVFIPPGAPGKVVVVDGGADPQVFDPATISAAQ